MKAILKLRGKREEVDVKPIGQTDKTIFYKDEKNGNVYPKDVLEFKEYYGG